ncbi:restriction endonuclease subunit S [Nitrospira sp. NS4]|uniref:restriction endonuclease subunit S n=1 Tax=Nitrospira sp. NS4 TaxID=3414498 RepID=UPI003C2CF6FB
MTVTARGDVGHAVYRTIPFCAIGRLLVLSSTYPCDLRFVTEFINQSVDFALESTGVPQLTAPQISKYTVALPPTKTEQEAIAAILSDMDAEIAALEAKLAKARLLKQGMMQELLTGRIRLV